MDIKDFDELMLFAKFKEKPGLYFGKPSLLSLRDQLFGMNMAFGMIYHEDAFVYLHQFIRWYHENVVKDQNGYACWWNHILYTCGGDDEMAFWSFFKRFEGYLKALHNPQFYFENVPVMTMVFHSLWTVISILTLSSLILAISSRFGYSSR